MYIQNNCQQSKSIVKSTRAIEHTDRISIEVYNPVPNECPAYDFKPSDGEALALEISLLPKMVVSDRVLFLEQIEQTMCTNKWLMLNCDCYIAILEDI